MLVVPKSDGFVVDARIEPQMKGGPLCQKFV